MLQELPRRKQVVTQEKSKVIKETENPFGEDEDEDKPSQAGPSTGHSRSSSLNPPVTGTVQSFSYDPKEKKKKDKKAKKAKPFNLEAEKEQMKSNIAEASIAATNLMNTLQTINREKERISENQLAVQRFEACKQLRRKILRYVSRASRPQLCLALTHTCADPQRRLRGMARQPAARQRPARHSPDDLRAAGPLNRRRQRLGRRTRPPGPSLPE